MALPVNKKKKPKIGGYAKKGKLSLVFDPEARKDYLTGFSKVSHLPPLYLHPPTFSPPHNSMEFQVYVSESAWVGRQALLLFSSFPSFPRMHHPCIPPPFSLPPKNTDNLPLSMSSAHTHVYI